MVSCPRVLDYEKLVLDHAIQLLEKVKEKNFRSQIAEDEMMLKHYCSKKGEGGKYSKEIMAHEYNVNIKRIFIEHLKTINVLVGIVERIDASLTDE
jgi:hypothetical protein